VSPRKSRAKLRGLMAMRSAKVVHLDRHPRAPESKQLGLPPGRRRKTTIVWAMSSATEIFFNRGKGKINPALIYARCCGRQNRRNKSMPAPHPRRYRTNHSTRVWSVQACSTPPGRMSPMSPRGKSFFLAPILVLSG
jgi:hypothetical protein